MVEMKNIQRLEILETAGLWYNWDSLINVPYHMIWAPVTHVSLFAAKM